MSDLGLGFSLLLTLFIIVMCFAVSQNAISPTYQHETHPSPSEDPLPRAALPSWPQ